MNKYRIIGIANISRSISVSSENKYLYNLKRVRVVGLSLELCDDLSKGYRIIDYLNSLNSNEFLKCVDDIGKGLNK